MNPDQHTILRNASQDILDGEKPFSKVSAAIDAATARNDNDPWFQARMRRFPGMSASVHAIATRAIGLCQRREDADIVGGDTASERYLSLVWPIDEEAGDAVAMLREANPTFRDAMGYSAVNHEIQDQVSRKQPETIRRRGKIAPDDQLPIPEFMATALTNNIHQTWATILRDMLWVRTRTGSLPESGALTARAWSRFGIYAHLSTVPGQMFNIASLGREVAKVKKKNIIATNDIQMVGPPMWIPAVDEYLQTGHVPDFAYTMAPSLRLTDEEIAQESRNHGVCAGQTSLTPYTTSGVPRPTDKQIKHFFRKSNRVAADGSFASIDYHFTRSIEAASQTIFSDPDYRLAIDSMVSLLLKADYLQR